MSVCNWDLDLNNRLWTHPQASVSPIHRTRKPLSAWFCPCPFVQPRDVACRERSFPAEQ